MVPYISPIHISYISYIYMYIVNIGQLLEMQTSLHTTAIACDSRPEPVYLRAQINLTPVILGTWREVCILLYRKAFSDYLLLTYTVHAHRLLGCSDCCSLATHIRLTGSMPRYKPFQASALLNMDSYHHI